MSHRPAGPLRYATTDLLAVLQDFHRGLDGARCAGAWERTDPDPHPGESVAARDTRLQRVVDELCDDGCPVRARCGAVGAATTRAWGVWGGRVQLPRPPGRPAAIESGDGSDDERQAS